jgi:SAM-dependent methyltransferase
MSVIRSVVPLPVREWLRRQLLLMSHRTLFLRRVRNFNRLRRTTPLSRHFGGDRGTPVDRYYIEKFLESRAADIRGTVLEFGDDSYARRFGRGVIRTEIVHRTAGNRHATIVTDISVGSGIADSTFDCVIATQLLPFVFDTRGVIRTLLRVLKPGGVVLVTTPGVSHQISRLDMERLGDYWRFTSLSLRLLFEEVLPPAEVTIETFGNVLAAAAFLYGLAAEELEPRELEAHDPDYEVSIAVRAVKPA